jgi:hypothetical protein
MLRQAAAEAKSRIASGQDKYRPTEESATAEAAAEQGKLMTVALRVVGASGPVTVVIGTERRELEGNGELESLQLPGTVDVQLRARVGSPVTRRLSGQAGEHVSLAVDLSVAPEPPPPDLPLSLVVPMAAAGAVGVVGFGMLIGFGSRSTEIYDDLDRSCGPHCGAAERDEADKGERYGVLANVGLAFGIAGAGASIALGTMLAVHESGADAGEQKELTVAVSPREAWLRLVF